MALSLKRVFHICGTLLAIVAIIFMAVRLRSHLDQIDFSALISTLWIYVLLLSLFVGVCNVFLVVVWCRCLEHLGVRAPFSSATWIYGFSQLGKYIPGNIFHLAGRQTLGMAEKLPAGKTLRSIVWELAILAGAAAGIFCPPFIAKYFCPSLSAGWILGIFALCCVAVPYGAGRLLGASLRSSMLWGILYLFCIGAVFGAILGLVTPLPLPPLVLFMVATGYIAAWFIGLVTPGAPAGLGIREGAMLLLMRDAAIPEADLLLAVTLCRIVTILGDCFFFLGSVALRYFLLKGARK